MFKFTPVPRNPILGVDPPEPCSRQLAGETCQGGREGKEKVAGKGHTQEPKKWRRECFLQNKQSKSFSF